MAGDVGDGGHFYTVTGLNLCLSAFWCGEVSFGDDAQEVVVIALDADQLRIGLRGQAAGQVYQLLQVGVVFQFIERGAVDFAVYTYSVAHRWDKNYIAGLQTVVVRGVTRQQQVVKIQFADQLAVPLVLNFTQGAGTFNAARHIESVGDGGEGTDRVRTGISGLAQHKHSHAAQFTQGNAGLNTDVLLGDSLLNLLPGLIKRQARNGLGA